MAITRAISRGEPVTICRHVEDGVAVTVLYSLKLRMKYALCAECAAKLLAMKSIETTIIVATEDLFAEGSFNMPIIAGEPN